MPDGLLLDTNFISQWQRGIVSAPDSTNLLASTTTLQEIYNMQDPGSWGYRYVPPYRLAFDSTEEFEQKLMPYLKSHTSRIRKGQAWLPSKDSFLVNYPSHLAHYGFIGQREQAHNLVAGIHEWPAKPFLKFVGSIVLGKPAARRVCSHYDFVLETEIKAVPASPAIAEKAVQLLDDLVASGVNVKANPRNTFNDMIILATALTNSVELRTDDKLLLRTALKSGMRRVDKSDGFVTLAPSTSNIDRRAPAESKGYINAPWRIRHVGTPYPYQTLPPVR